jgi:hypothetical protein
VHSVLDSNGTQRLWFCDSFREAGRNVLLDELGSIPATLNTSKKDNCQHYDRESCKAKYDTKPKEPCTVLSTALQLTARTISNTKTMQYSIITVVTVLVQSAKMQQRESKRVVQILETSTVKPV